MTLFPLLASVLTLSATAVSAETVCEGRYAASSQMVDSAIGKLGDMIRSAVLAERLSTVLPNQRLWHPIVGV